MKIPNYVKDIMGRAEYSYRAKAEPGYTIKIQKRTDHQMCYTLAEEAERIVAWANREYRKLAGRDAFPIAEVISCPTETHYCTQYAVVTIFDPIMMHIEKFMPQRGR